VGAPLPTPMAISSLRRHARPASRVLPKTRARGLGLVRRARVGDRGSLRRGPHWRKQHRYGETASEQLKQPEPLLQNPEYVVAMAKAGHSLPAYAYALNNPLYFTDVDGRNPKRFKENFDKMNKTLVPGGDKYFHCMANCESAKEGWLSEVSSEILSELKELKDEYWTGYPRSDCDKDRAANNDGRSGGRDLRGSVVPCSEVCKQHRPAGLPAGY
jgi:hypothetical protein